VVFRSETTREWRGRRRFSDDARHGHCATCRRVVGGSRLRSGHVPAVPSGRRRRRRKRRRRPGQRPWTGTDRCGREHGLHPWIREQAGRTGALSAGQRGRLCCATERRDAQQQQRRFELRQRQRRRQKRERRDGQRVPLR